MIWKKIWYKTGAFFVYHFLMVTAPKKNETSTSSKCYLSLEMILGKNWQIYIGSISNNKDLDFAALPRPPEDKTKLDYRVLATLKKYYLGSPVSIMKLHMV